MTLPLKRIYVCSPLRAANGRTVEDHIALARKLCAYAAKLGYAPFAPHAFYTTFLDDRVTSERVLGMDAGEAWLRAAEEVWVYRGYGESTGMRAEICLAQELGIPDLPFPDVPVHFLGRYAPPGSYGAAP